jgi:hypothetical protein
MAAVNLKVRSGNRIVVTLDNKKVGLMQSVRANDDYAPEPASGIGDIHVAEHVPTMARHRLSVSSMVLNTGSMRAAGVAAINGDDVLNGLVFDILIQDKDTGENLRKYVGCSYASGTLEVSKHSIVMASGEFNALDVVGEGG